MLTVEKAFDIRFSEIDMMQVVWHGTYPVYLEDAREAFGNRYGLSYQRYMVESTFAPIVEMKLNYKRPLKYGMTPIVKITYHPTLRDTRQPDRRGMPDGSHCSGVHGQAVPTALGESALL